MSWHGPYWRPGNLQGTRLRSPAPCKGPNGNVTACPQDIPCLLGMHFTWKSSGRFWLNRVLAFGSSNSVHNRTFSLFNKINVSFKMEESSPLNQSWNQTSPLPGYVFLLQTNHTGSYHDNKHNFPFTRHPNAFSLPEQHSALSLRTNRFTLGSVL